MRRGGDRVAWAGSATFATPRCIEEVPWPGVHDIWEEVCLIGLNIIMRIYEIWRYTYNYIYIVVYYIWWYIFLFFGCDTSATGNSWMHVRWFRPFRRLATPKVLTATNWKKCWAWIRMLRSLPALLCRWGSLEMATRSEDELFLEVLLLVRY